MQWAEQFKSLLSSPLGQELIRTLREDLGDSIVQDAQKALSPDEAFGLLKESRGVIRSIEHLQFLAFTPTDEGSKGAKQKAQ